MSGENLNYEEDVRIDEDALDVEWLDQPMVALKYVRYVAELRHQVTALEEKKKAIRSELIDEANRNPKELLGKEKPNASDIEAFYRRSEKYKEVVEKLNDKNYELELAEGAKNEITYTRRESLKHLVWLHAQQYFAGPSTPRDLSQEWEKREKNKRSNKTASKGISKSKNGMKRSK